MGEQFEDIKGVNRSRKSTKDWKYNDQKTKDKRTDNLFILLSL